MLTSNSTQEIQTVSERLLNMSICCRPPGTDAWSGGPGVGRPSPSRGRGVRGSRAGSQL